MDHRRFKAYRSVVNEEARKLAEGYKQEAAAESINDNADGHKARIAISGACKQAGYKSNLGQNYNHHTLRYQMYVNAHHAPYKFDIGADDGHNIVPLDKKYDSS